MKTEDSAKWDEQFNMTLSDRANAMFSMNALDLLSETNMNCLIEGYGSHIKALDRSAAAAYFCKWFSRVALFLQYSVSIRNQALDLSLSNVTVQLYPELQAPRLSFKLNQWVAEDGPTNEVERLQWRDQVLSNFYAHTVRPLFQSASMSAGIHVRQLWGQMPTLFNNQLDTLKAETNVISIKQRMEEDYQFLVYGLDPAILQLKRNPFDVKVRMIEHTTDPEKQIRMKNTCCLYYLTGDAQHCYSCPRISESDRVIKREAYQAQAAMANL